MSSSITLRGTQLLPLWRRRIPKYPVYWKGDPQLRVFLPQFWMRIINPEHEIPKNQVHFEVHPQPTFTLPISLPPNNNGTTPRVSAIVCYAINGQSGQSPGGHSRTEFIARLKGLKVRSILLLVPIVSFYIDFLVLNFPFYASEGMPKSRSVMAEKTTSLPGAHCHTLHCTVDSSGGQHVTAQYRQPDPGYTMYMDGPVKSMSVTAAAHRRRR
ncbi:hypothetical protein RRG08_034592 [Elysia crispata]|uniref:Uncharacterized protein n=1 Tax=Elysia crispata TaxID=231223 RepID=A0AAE1E8C9_9GAST|nr:hypothetical protein RRG08_034592 [Elysia crispata]